MQPYLFPYIGYFQLINSVDIFVIYDDVQFIKGGWINRNRFLINNKETLFTFGLRKSSTFTNINNKFFSCNFQKEKIRFIHTIEQHYKKAPFFNSVIALLKEIMDYQQDNLVEFIYFSLKKICEYLDIDTPLVYSSNINKNENLTGEERIIEINKTLHSSSYINPIGGVELYSKSLFMQEGIDLFFLRSKPIQYKQFNSDFIPWLSIIDVLMFNSKDTVKTFLTEYELI